MPMPDPASLRCLLVIAVLHAAATAGAADRPNILFILVDDLGAHDLSGEGSDFYQTPRVDALAERGMRFTQGYATCQVCSPSRASILTGKYPTRTGITNYIGARTGEQWRASNRHTTHLPPEYARSLAASEHTLAEVLRDAGYRTFFAGKWHLGGEGAWPTDHGFETNIGGWDGGSPRGGYFGPYKNPNLTAKRPGESLTLRLADETAAFIAGHTESHPEQPFLAYLAFYTVHGPIQTTENLWAKYRDKATAAGPVDDRFEFDRRLCVRQVQDCPIYAGMVETMDTAVGRVLDELDRQGLTDSTIVCFTSDNGGVSSGDAYATSNLPLRGGKGRQWEGGIREPYYLVAPGITEAGSTSDVPVSGIDWYPTLLDLAGVDIPAEQQVDGVSLKPLLAGAAIAERPLFWHYPHYGNQGGDPSSIVRDGDWKLIRYHETGAVELYDLARDPGEQNDVAAAHADVVLRLSLRLDAWLTETGATFPTPDPQFDPAARAKRLEELRTRGQARLESIHARYLDADYRPNATWWGSQD